ncbi:MAG TPA: pilus assembly protein TadG-related protein [Frankiaceae bacterium]|nr:pilus assembly protein TadG-related protein [Frankiaceae bacterium]
MRRRSDDGTVLLLTLFLGLVLILATVVVVDASAAFLARRTLASQADGAALRAAQEVDLGAFYTGAGDVLPLADPTRAVEAYVTEHFPGTRVASVETDGTSVTVTLVRPLRLPLAPPGWANDATVTATATARLLRTP